MDITRIHNAFSPTKQITEPQLFVGRRTEISNSILALPDAGSFIAIYGLRGVGKSSIGEQIKLIAQGDVTLPKMLDLQRLIPKKGFNHLTIYVHCDKFTNNVSDLLKRIVFGDDKNPSLFSFTKRGERKLEEIKESFTVEGGASLFGAKIGAERQSERTYKTYLSDDLVQQFKQLLGLVQRDNQQKTGLLILVDEFDVLKNKNGFSSLIKTCSSPFVKFGVIGIANTITELVEDHSSIGRQLYSVEVPRMPRDELFGIIAKAEYQIGKEIVFDDDSKEIITAQAGGFPYFVHLLGKEALLEAFDKRQKTITKQTIETIRKKITEGRLVTIYESIYHSAVKNSPQRELLLKFFAEEHDDEIFSETVYGNAKGLGITNPSQLMKELTNPQDQSLAVLTRVREKYFRFVDPVFKVYARIRNWKF